jgi:putative membrane protein insertion efficiency factor
MCKLLIFLITLYQYIFSSIFGNCCRFEPTCSEYAKIAIRKYKLFGLFLAIKRIIKCNPFSHGGHDPI